MVPSQMTHQLAAFCLEISLCYLMNTEGREVERKLEGQTLFKLLSGFELVMNHFLHLHFDVMCTDAENEKVAKILC